MYCTSNAKDDTVPQLLNMRLGQRERARKQGAVFPCSSSRTGAGYNRLLHTNIVSPWHVLSRLERQHAVETWPRLLTQLFVFDETLNGIPHVKLLRRKRMQPERRFC